MTTSPPELTTPKAAPQLTETAQQKAQQAQRVVQDKSGAVAGAVLAALVLLILRRRRRGKAQQIRGRSRARRDRQGTRVLAVLGSLMRLRSRGREEKS